LTATLLDGVNAAIENLRPSFEADNFDVTLDSLSPSGDVVIAIAAGPGACLDCLVPDPMLKQIVDVAVRRYAPAVTSVAVVKRGFDTDVSPDAA
jgi:Fe-S cluster biogenesis protein NfuA